MTRPIVSIIALIYRSPSFARSFFQHLRNVTPEIDEGSAEFFFVANNATPQVISTLKREDIPHYEFWHKIQSDAERFELGFARPEYIGRVYAAYNYGVAMSKAPYVVLLNSDMIMSDNWLGNLLSERDSRTVISPQLVERHHPRFGVFPGAIEKHFGRDFKSMNLMAWSRFSHEYVVAHEGAPLVNGGPYMPALFQRSWFTDFGGFPHGNIAGSSPNHVAEFGDEAFFRKLKEHGISHKTTPRSLCYHFKEGERSAGLLQVVSSHLVPTLSLPLRRIYRRIRR